MNRPKIDIKDGVLAFTENGQDFLLVGKEKDGTVEIELFDSFTRWRKSVVLSEKELQTLIVFLKAGTRSNNNNSDSNSNNE